MSLLQEALQRRQERAPKLERINELHALAYKLLVQRGRRLSHQYEYSGYCVEIPVGDSEKVEIEVFSHGFTETARRTGKLDQKKVVVVLIKDLSRRISLNGEETEIYDTSVKPESVKTLDEITQKDLDQWEEVIQVLEKIGSET